MTSTIPATLLAMLLQAIAAGAVSSSIPTITTLTTPPACKTPLSQSDVDWSWDDPCPKYFHPLPSQGALGGSSLTIFGFPALVDFSGSIVGQDGTSTTYALTCMDTDIDIIGAQCTTKGVVVPFTASGWNWHMTTTQSDYDWTTAGSMTATINPAGSITVRMMSTVTPYDSSTYTTSYTWTGTVDLADPSVVPIVGLEKIGGTDGPSTSAAASSSKGGVGSSQASASSGQSTKSAVSSQASTSIATATGRGAAASLLVRTNMTSDHNGLFFGAASILIATLAFIL